MVPAEYMLLVAMPGAPSSVLAPSSDGHRSVHVRAVGGHLGIQ